MFYNLLNEWLGDKLKIVFSPDVIICGWLYSKHQLTNYPTHYSNKPILFLLGLPQTLQWQTHPLSAWFTPNTAVTNPSSFCLVYPKHCSDKSILFLLGLPQTLQRQTHPLSAWFTPNIAGTNPHFLLSFSWELWGQSNSLLQSATKQVTTWTKDQNGSPACVQRIANFLSSRKK